MNDISTSKIIRLTLAATIAAAGGATAGVPLNNLQGTGGIAFNPLAYTAGLPWDDDGGGDSTNAVEKTDSPLNGVVSRPQVGAWYVNLNDAGINWWAGSAAISFADRVEVSGGYGFINAHKYGDKSINTYNVGAKVRFLDENAFDTSWVPALAVGGVWKYTDSRTVDAFHLDDNGFDGYVVASKLITQTPVPVLLSAGLLLSDEVVNGVVGHNDYDVVAFGNIDVLPAENIAIGVEMAESQAIRYTGGDRFEILDRAKARKNCETAFNGAVDLFAWLCERFGVDPMEMREYNGKQAHAIMSHAEWNQLRGVAGHTDPQHYWTQLGMPYTMDSFRQAVKAKLEGSTQGDGTIYRIQVGAFRNQAYAEAYLARVKEYFPEAFIKAVLA